MSKMTNITDDEQVNLLFPSLSFQSSNTSILNESQLEKLNEEVSDHPIQSSLYGKQGIHICHINACSIVNKMPQIKNLLKNKKYNF